MQDNRTPPPDYRDAPDLDDILLGFFIAWLIALLALLHWMYTS